MAVIRIVKLLKHSHRTLQVFTRIYKWLSYYGCHRSYSFLDDCPLMVKSTGITHANQIFKQTLMAGIIAAVALMFIYISLGFIGNHMAVPQEK